MAIAYEWYDLKRDTRHIDDENRNNETTMVKTRQYDDENTTVR
jgi:hypothetical protein